MHERGVVSGVRGMYFVGLHFLYSMSSATVIGVGRDAKHVVRAIQTRALATSSQDSIRLPEAVAA
jgi:putative flavoprotein involved in K+ transport